MVKSLQSTVVSHQSGAGSHLIVFTSFSPLRGESRLSEASEGRGVLPPVWVGPVTPSGSLALATSP